MGKLPLEKSGGGGGVGGARCLPFDSFSNRCRGPEFCPRSKGRSQIDCFLLAHFLRKRSKLLIYHSHGAPQEATKVPATHKVS